LAGQRAVAEILIAKGADVNAVDTESGSTPLHHAAGWGRKEVVELLLTKKADPNRRNKAGQTPLDLAISNNQTEVIQILKPAGEIPE